MRISNCAIDIVLLGRHCRFTATVLQALIEEGHRILLVVVAAPSPGCRVVIPAATKPRISLATPSALPTVAGLAWSSGAKLVETSREELASLPRRFRELREGVLISACFPWKLPLDVLGAPPLGALNVHPSLLPAHRGPDPVFWALHAGDVTSGATVHWMNRELDAGPILAQESFDLPLRSRAVEIEHTAVSIGARLLVDKLRTLSETDAPAIVTPLADLSPIEPQPTSQDLRLDTSWDAERAFRFIYGTAPDYGPLTLQMPSGRTLHVTDATRLYPGNELRSEPAETDGRPLVQFSDGVVEVVPVPG